MTSKEIRKQFLTFFESKQHLLANAAPIVIKNDPTLMFTNAGMNQFKEIFLGNQAPAQKRVADSQPCLRVSGKHNDLEDVGKDTYHHTLFEMLGNWSFGDYFKKDAISWAWELLVDVYKLPKDRLYATVFGGDMSDNLNADDEARGYWSAFLPSNHIINGSKKDNFWEMGDTGPCGPCTELHIDLRSEEERTLQPGETLVNKDHPQVIEIWNLVFMEFNRLVNGSLQPLPDKHVDTGMGFERLCMALQGKTSNYDTDVFQPLIQKIAQISGFNYGSIEKVDIAFRVIADHIRAVTFIIADGQLPSNNKAGYVCRRILRRAVRYGYTYLNLQEPFMFKLIPTLSDQFAGMFDQIAKQEAFITKIVFEEEQSFLRTLSNGLRKIESEIEALKAKNGQTLDGQIAFELYDTYGFPLDLTQLILSENNLTADIVRFNNLLDEQRNRSRNDASSEASDWVYVQEELEGVHFVGYDTLQTTSELIRYRSVKSKVGELYQLVITPTPFYAESGGQVGDKGELIFKDEVIEVVDTQKENNLIVHITKKLPKALNDTFTASVNKNVRNNTARNHTATHLLHASLRKKLGTHVEQKGSLVNPEMLRFDFSHYAKVSIEEIAEIEAEVNQKIADEIALEELRNVPIEKAKAMGAMALFGEKYGDSVRVIVFDPAYSVELCGGTHVSNTRQIGLFKIVSESSIASGVRRIEAITSNAALAYLNNKEQTLNAIQHAFNNPKDLLQTIEKLKQEHQQLAKEKEKFVDASLLEMAKSIISDSSNISNGIVIQVSVNEPEHLKRLYGNLKQFNTNIPVALGAVISDKAHVLIAIPENIVTAEMNANKLIKDNAALIKGGGGGQPFLATAGGSDIAGLPEFLKNIKLIFNA